jgi:hypothetical protein
MGLSLACMTQILETQRPWRYVALQGGELTHSRETDAKTETASSVSMYLNAALGSSKRIDMKMHNSPPLFLFGAA